MNRRGRLLSLCSVSCAIVLSACAGKGRLPVGLAGEQDPKLSTFAYVEQGDLLTLVTATRATRYREHSRYIPVEICIANRGLRELRLTRESFTLVDAQGNRYPVATPRELLEDYEHLDMDQTRLAHLEQVISNRFAAYTRYPSKFSPSRQIRSGHSGLVRNRISLPRYGYLVDFLYFPRPASGVVGQTFELFVDSADLPDPVFVRFLVR